MTVITFHSFDGRSPARRRNSAAQLLEIDVPISVHVQRQEQPKTKTDRDLTPFRGHVCNNLPLTGTGRYGRTDQGSDATQIQLAGRRSPLQGPKELLELAYVLLLQVRDTGQRLIEGRSFQFRTQRDTRRRQ